MSGFDNILFDEALFDPTTGEPLVIASFFRISVGNVDETVRLVLGNEIASRLTIDQTQDGTTGQVWLNYSDLATLPPVGTRFVFTFFGGNKIVLQARTVSKVGERYHDPSMPLWIHEFDLIDPLSALNSQKLPSRRPLVDTTTGAVFAAVIAAMDPTLVLDLAAGSTVGAVNFSEFSTFGDLRRSEIVGAGYVLRMNGGLNVKGALDTGFGANSDWKIDKNDPRYTPSRFRIDPPNEIFTSVEVVPQKEVPLYRVSEVHEMDGRVMPVVGLEAKPFGLEDSEPFKLTAGADISDPDLWEQTGSVGMSGSHMLLNGSLTNLDARPYVFPFMISWVGIIPDQGTGYQFGFKDGNGNWIWSVTSGDYPLTPSGGDDQHTYEIFTLPKAGGSIEVWGFHLHQNFNVDDEILISTVLSVDYVTNTVILAAPWTIDNTYIRFIAKNHIPAQPEDGLERGRTRILRRTGATLVCDALPLGIEPGDPVTRGVKADSVITIKLIKNVAAVGGYGLPAISGSGVHLQEFIIQRTGQIEGYLLSEYNSMPDQTYPRALRLDVDATEFSDGVVAGSGSSATVNFSRKFSTERQLMVALNYVVGGKRKFPVSCGTGGGHLVVPIAQEQDPSVLAAIAARLCAISSTNHPRATSNMESPLIAGIPLPFDPLPLNVDTPYRVSVPSVPILSSKLTLMGVSDYYQQEVLLWDIDAGDKSPAERAQEEALRGTVLAKYPIRVASIGGARITGVSWDDVTLSASVAGAGTIYGPMGQVLNLGGGINPAVAAGIADPNAAPMTLRCTTDAGNLRRDVLVFTLIYPPKPVVQEAVKAHFNARTNLVLFDWSPPSGALAYRVQRLTDPDGDGAYQYQEVDRITASEYSLPYEKHSRFIKLKSIGLCDKESDWVEIEAILPPLVVSLFEAVDVSLGTITFRVSAPPTGRDITGRVRFLKVLVFQNPAIPPTQRSDFNLDDDRVTAYRFEPPPLDDNTTLFWRCQISFADTDADDQVFVAACWVDGFKEEGPITPPFDATLPPLSVGTINITDFFQAADQPDGGALQDDDEFTPEIEYSGIYRYHLGRHTDWVKMLIEESEASTGVIPNPTFSGSTIKASEDVTDDFAVAGYVDVNFKRTFRSGPGARRAYRPLRIVAVGIRAREIINGAETTVVANRVVLQGYDGTGPPPALVAHEVDGVFDYNQFVFWPGTLIHNYPVVTGVRIRQLDNGLKYAWDLPNDPALRRIMVVISATPFGTRGPFTDGAIATDLDAINGEGGITLYNVANAIRNTACVVIDHGKFRHLRIHNDDVFATLTIQTGVAYYVAVIAQKASGRWSSAFSIVLNTVSGQPVTLGDAGPPGPVSNLNLLWKEGKGYRIKFAYPTVNATSIEYFWAVFYDDTGPVNYMNPETGQVASPNDETTARFQISGHTLISMRRANMASGFVSDGVKVKVWAVNVVDDVLTEALIGDRISTGFVLPGSDAGGPAIDGGPPDAFGTVGPGPTANLKFKNDLIAKLFAGTAANWETVYDIEIGFFYPSGANGTTTARNFFDPDTGLDTGVWSTALQTATFGVGGNSGFFTGGRAKFIGKVAKAALPAGALTGGIGIVARAYNKTQGATGPVPTTNPATSAGFATGVVLSTLALGPTDSNFANDRDAANWVNSTAQATPAQSGSSLIITKKVIWLKWDQPIHLQSAPDDIPRAIFKYGYKLRAGNDSNNWLDPKVPGTAIAVDASAEFFTDSLETSLGTMRADMAAVFQSNGLKLAVRAWTYVGGIATAGPFTQYTAAVPVAGDPTAADTTAPTGLNIPAVKAKKNGIAVHGMYATGQNEGIQYTEVSYYVTNAAGTSLIGHIDPATNGLSVSQVFRNIGTSGHDLLIITKAQLIAAFGGPSDRAIGVQYRMTNLIGTTSLPVSLLSPTQTVFLPFSSLIGDDVVADTLVPSSLTTPTLSNQPEVLKARGMHADANNNEWITNLIVFKVVDNAGVLVNYIDPVTNGATASEATAQIDAKSGHYNLRITALQLALAFGGPANRNVRVYFYARNPIGISLKSPDSASLPFSSLAVDLVSQDAGVPSALQTPNLIAKKDGILAKGIRATANNNVMLYDELVIKVVDNAGAFVGYLDPTSVTGAAVAATETAAKLQVADGQAHFHKVRVDDLISVWGGPANRHLRCYYYATNEQGTNLTPSADSTSLAFASLGTDSATWDTAASGAVQNLTLVWKEKVGYKSRWQPPITGGLNSIQGYWVVYFNDNAGTVYMDAATGQQAAVQTEAGARIFVPDTHHSTHLKSTDFAAPFSATGVKVKVYAQNIVNGTKTDGASSTTTPLVTVGSDIVGTGVTVDSGPPDPPTVTAIWKPAKGTKVSLVQSTVNVTSLRDYGVAFFHPANATGLVGSRRNFFNPNIGAATGVWEATVSTTASFGRSGNSEFFIGNSKSFNAHALKADLPAGAITGGIGIIVRAFNYTNAITPTETPSTSDANFPLLSVAGAGGTSVSSASITADFASDRDAANWVNSAAQASVAQAGLTLIITKKVIWLKWDQPIHLQSTPDDTPRGIFKYGYKLRAGDDSPNWLDPKVPGTAIAVDASAEFFTDSLETSLGTMRADMAAVFQTNGLKLAVRAWTYVNGVATAGPFTQYTAAVPVAGDPTAADTLAPQGLVTPTLKAKKQGLNAWDLRAASQNEQHQYTEVAFDVITDASVLVNYIDPATNLASVSPVYVNIGKAGEYLLAITKAQLLTAFGGSVTNRNVRVFYRVTNLIGTTNLTLPTIPSGAIVAFASLIGDDVSQDTVVPSSLTTPILKNQPEVIKAQNMHADANNSEHLYTEVVFKVVTDAGALVNYVDPSTNSFTATEATAKINIGKSGHFNLPISKAQLSVAFGGPANRNLRVYFYVTNRIGSSLASPDSLSLPFSGLLVDSLPQDTAAPSGLTTPTIHAKRGAVLVKGLRPTVSVNQLLYNEIVVKCVDDGGVLVNYLDLTNNTASGSEQRFNIGGSGHFELRFTQSQLVALFGGPPNRNLRVYYFSTNAIGTSASPSADSASFAFSALSNDIAEDAAAAGPVVALTLAWKEKVGYKSRWQPPTTGGLNAILGYWVVYFNDAAGTIYMDPATGQQAAVQTEAGARIFVPDTHHSTHLKSTDFAAPFSATGVKVKVYAQNFVNGAKTDGTSSTTTPLVLVGSDVVGTGVVVDSGPANNPTVTALWKPAKGIKIKMVQDTVNVTTLHDYGLAFFYPSSATGQSGSRRNFFNPDTGIDTGVWEASVSTTATFGRGGNSEFFAGNSKRFSPGATRADLPSGAVTGGVGILARAYNYTNAVSPTETPSTSDANFPILTGTGLATVSIASDFANDRDAANWINSAAAASVAQSGLTLIITKKTLWLKWDQPIHLQSTPDDTPRGIFKYGYKLRAGDDSNNWLDPKIPGTPITVDANSEFFTDSLETSLGTMRADMAAVFQSNGLKLAVRAWTYVNGVATAGPFTQYTAAVPVAGDPTAADTLAPQGLVTPTLKAKKQGLNAWDLRAASQNEQHQYTEVAFDVITDASVLVNYIDPATNLASVSPVYVNIGKAGEYLLAITKAQLLTAFGGSVTNRNVRVFYRVTNLIGTTNLTLPTIPSSAILAFSSLIGDDVARDLVVPTSLTIPTLLNQPEVLKAQNMHADANNNEHQFTEVVFKVVTDGGVLVNYINPANNSFTPTESVAKINVGKSGHYNLRITAAQLAAAFGGPANRNVRVYFYVTNLIGLSAASPDSASLPFSSISTDLVSQDLGVPSSLQTPNLIAKKDGVLAKGVRATANNNVMFYDELVIKVVDDAGALVGYLDPVSVSGAANAGSEAAAKLQVADGQAHFHKVRADDLISVWGGPANRNLRCYYYATNEKGTNATPSSDSASLAFASLGADSGGAAPSALVTAAVFANTVDGDPDKSLARVSLTLTTANTPTTFAVDSISSVEIILIRRNSTNTADLGDPFSEIKALSTADLALATCKHEFFLRVGDRFRIIRVVSRNGDKRLESAALTTDFIAGGFTTDQTCPAPSFVVQPAADGNKLVSFTIQLANTATPVLFKNLTIEVSYGGSTFRNIEGSPIGLKSLDDLNVASGAHNFVFSVKRRPGFTFDVRATAKAVGVAASTTTNAAQLAASGDDVFDAAAPVAPPAPTVKEQDGDIVAKAKPPSSGGNSITKWQMAITDVNSAPTSADPPVATGGATVFDFQEGADSFSKWRVPGVTGTRYFWARCQNASNPGVWSGWSASSSITDTSRPLKDFIGSGAPNQANVDADPLAPSGFTDVALTIPGDKVPVHIWDDGTTIYYEFVLPTDPKALSLIAIEYEIWRAATGALKKKETINPSTTSSIEFPLHSWIPAFRMRIRNMFRSGGNAGWSGRSHYASGPAGGGNINYDPAANPPPDNDFYSEGSYPVRYPTL